MKRFFQVIIALSLLFGSCTSQKQLLYLQDLDTGTKDNIFFKQSINYKIQTQDILYIRIYSMNPKANEIFNLTSGRYQQNLFQNETSLFINGYSVTDSGNVDLPIIGKVNVLYKTVEEAKYAIQSHADEILNNSSVVVKLISFKFSVLGEVHAPGMYRNYNNQLTVLEAIAMAGDITDYGNRKKILIIRPIKSGTETFRIDLTRSEVLSSEGFFLLPNDIVYVEPISTKTFRINTPTFSLFLSTVTTSYIDFEFY
ncbi:MAG: polysaccharide biosynthesis/export family protein [Bacteroidetes bacterium]|nr:polysaccharide biosynthesis/export family protein [Bacteroidota bacterium]